LCYIARTMLLLEIALLLVCPALIVGALTTAALSFLRRGMVIAATLGIVAAVCLSLFLNRDGATLALWVVPFSWILGVGAAVGIRRVVGRSRAARTGS